jgi:hypothetical protein
VTWHYEPRYDVTAIIKHLGALKISNIIEDPPNLIDEVGPIKLTMNVPGWLGHRFSLQASFLYKYSGHRRLHESTNSHNRLWAI